MANTLFIAIVSTLISLFCGILAGYALARLKFRFAGALGTGSRHRRRAAWAALWHVTWPLLLPVTMVVVLFSVIQTFADFQLVYVLTGGGPA